MLNTAHEQSPSDRTDSTPPALEAAELENVWARIQDKLKREFGQAVYASWFRKLSLANAEPYSKHSYRLVLEATTKFVRDWVATRYLERIEELFQAEDPRFYTVAVTTAQGETTTAPRPASALENVSQRGAAAGSAPRSAPTMAAWARPGGEHETQTPRGSFSSSPSASSQDELSGYEETKEEILFEGIGTPLDKRLTFDSFVACPANELALAAAKRLLDSSGTCFNPLFLYSKVGLGKTHLMQAIAWEKTRRDPNINIVYLSAEKFMYHFVHALRTRTMFAFKQQLRAADMFMVDDIQFISGKETTQDEFFQTFNALIDQNKQIVLSADKCPMDFEDMAERVRSRLNGGLVIDISAYDASMRLAILKKKIELGYMGEDAHALSEEVLEFVADKVSSNVRELEGALRRLVTYASVMKTRLTKTAAQDILKDLLKLQEKRVTIESIQACVSSYYDVENNLLTQRGRKNKTSCLVRRQNHS